MKLGGAASKTVEGVVFIVEGVGPFPAGTSSEVTWTSAKQKLQRGDGH